MGALHRGHGELIQSARNAVGDAGEVVVSIFVNPLQFSAGGDYEKYPRPEEADDEFCREAGVDILFRPAPEEMYAADFSVSVDENLLANTLEGRSRPGHFRGVTTIVSKLFHIVSPERAYFGQKDAAQVAVLRKMVRDLNFNVEIVVCPIVREADGLALSSRNVYLDPEQRRQALVLSRALMRVKELVSVGEWSATKLLEEAAAVIASEPAVKVDYLAAVDPDTLDSVDGVRGGALIAVAAWVGNTRLIDNLLVGYSSE